MADTEKPVTKAEPPEMEWTVPNVMKMFGGTEADAREMIAFRKRKTYGDVHGLEKSKK